MEDQYGDLKTLFLSWALHESLPNATSAIQYRHKLKNITNQFADLYKKQIVPQLFTMYSIGDNDESSEILLASIQDIAREFNRAKPEDYPAIAELIRAFNNGDVRMEDPT